MRDADSEEALFRGLDPFSALPRPTLERLADKLVRLRFQPGAVIVREGDEGGYLYVIAAGNVDLVRTRRPAEVRGPGECFGEDALLRANVQRATVVARTAVTVHALDGSTFTAALRADTSWSPEAIDTKRPG